ncbi:MAG: hypothetical protein UV71_C0009G0019 [Microgenomates group bacterium GW2011_GWC1_43_13]|uniref:Uncharacterized protein n=2 Tax=Candidatus Woeseibacteriota TaxID=1752722 RepID=A0A837I9G7_9BACT|nr:MAG: hypothetical protein UV71_C0009G0019 [Microgenomates group bacterium GW2011_GWC1_43_13]KKT32926.1 MAG: hypothetical protein UW20_C0007G0018 [Candidatus Woesebacteria bacterium GW2011_GWB1_44_11]KKT54511.1 MAG: hypothetical protein UW47_C0005G0059 [Candidatus Woesebacteria bacterium GW2011_GWA1_44_23]
MLGETLGLMDADGEKEGEMDRLTEGLIDADGL